MRARVLATPLGKLGSAKRWLSACDSRIETATDKGLNVDAVMIEKPNVETAAAIPSVRATRASVSDRLDQLPEPTRGFLSGAIDSPSIATVSLTWSSMCRHALGSHHSHAHPSDNLTEHDITRRELAVLVAG